MNPIMLKVDDPLQSSPPALEALDKIVSRKALQAAELLLAGSRETFYAKKQKQILAQILDEIGFAAKVRERLAELERNAGIKSLAQHNLERTAELNGWL